MNKHELQLGNYVDYDGRILQIDCLAEDAPFLITADYGPGVVSYDNIKPVDLSAEMLSRLEFIRLTIHETNDSEKFDTWYRVHHGATLEFVRMDKESGRFEFNTGGTRWVPCDHVHTVQNLFRIFSGENIVFTDKFVNDGI